MTNTNRLALLGLATGALIFASAPALASLGVSNRSPRQGETLEVTLTEAPAATGAAGNTDPASNANSLNAAGNVSAADNASPTDSLKTAGAGSTDINNSQPAQTGNNDPSLTFNGHSYKFFKVPRVSKPEAKLSEKEQSGSKQYRLQALIAVPADLDPGKYDLQSGGDKVTLKVLAGIFPLQHIQLPPAKDNFDTAPGEEEAVEKAKSTLSDYRLWNGPFMPPSKARTSTGFGLKRVVNGRLLKDYFHAGLDFAAGLGSPITACASGKVVLVGRGFKLHGNTVAIDHGQGVVSFYIHMQTIKVKVGEAVRQGEKIGTVGQTGRATGPHLHFSIYVNKVAANPKNWFASSF